MDLRLIEQILPFDSLQTVYRVELQDCQQQCFIGLSNSNKLL